MNKNETIADIRKEAEAEFREFIEKHEPDSIKQFRAMQRFNHAYDRIEAAAARMEQHAQNHATRHAEAVAADNCRDCILRQPDPDWIEICEKCHDGEEPPDCEYFGEPNGCNSPIYGQHPKMKNNMAKLREVVEVIALVILPEEEPGENGWLTWLRSMQRKALAAITAPARNCDIGTANEQSDRFDAYCANNDCHTKPCPADRMGFVSCEFVWGQMPYIESEVAK